MSSFGSAPRIGLLLAAGRSLRFGSTDKLRAPYRGRPLITHAASTLAGAGLDRLIVVLRDPDLAGLLPGFEPVITPQDRTALSQSLRQGIQAAQHHGTSGVLVALADMPLIPDEHLARIIRAGMEHELAASTCDGQHMPPAWFGARHFPALCALHGDRGAGKLLKTALPDALIPCNPQYLRDIDRPEDIG